jgi:hypothetical protein
LIGTSILKATKSEALEEWHNALRALSLGQTLIHERESGVPEDGAPWQEEVSLRHPGAFSEPV